MISFKVLSEADADIPMEMDHPELVGIDAGE
jgi:hypothetical protein